MHPANIYWVDSVTISPQSSPTHLLGLSLCLCVVLMQNRLWRKSRSAPPAGSDCYGVDLNRNFKANWGSEFAPQCDLLALMLVTLLCGIKTFLTCTPFIGRMKKCHNPFKWTQCGGKSCGSSIFSALCSTNWNTLNPQGISISVSFITVVISHF